MEEKEEEDRGKISRQTNRQTKGNELKKRKRVQRAQPTRQQHQQQQTFGAK